MIRTNKLKGNQLIERLKKLSNPINESVPMVMPTKYHDRISPTGRLTKTFGNQKSIEDMEDDEEVNLEDILREMGYGEEEEEEFDLGDYDEEELREYIQNQIREGFHEEMENLEYEDGPVGDKLELDELVMDIENGMEGDIDESITYNIDYKSYNPSKYHNITRTFNNERHFNNWYSWMTKQGLKIIGVHKP